ncbi:MAG: hypothetical protein OXE50_08720 [Chloroflexi bacterium]|nr:hypothetical protein [Chloroflexota bacterium]
MAETQPDKAAAFDLLHEAMRCRHVLPSHHGEPYTVRVKDCTAFGIDIIKKVQTNGHTDYWIDPHPSSVIIAGRNEPLRCGPYDTEDDARAAARVAMLMQKAAFADDLERRLEALERAFKAIVPKPPGA